MSKDLSRSGYNVLLLIVDSLRAKSLRPGFPGRPLTPFLDSLAATTTCFQRAYATECWTLPSHMSMFTGLLPSQHGAHFQSMAYTGSAPTIAEVLRGAGYETELVTRNFIFDGTIPGVTRGFQRNTCLLSPLGRRNLFTWMLALTKPRSRRLIRETGFFHPKHRASREFLARYSQTLMPADRLSLSHLLERMQSARQHNARSFWFCNLYDVHWPYPVSESSVLNPWMSPGGIVENLRLPVTLPRIGSHRYLQPGFRLSDSDRNYLLRRYHRAIELMDQKLAWFWSEAERGGLFDDTLVILTSDHGEAFGEHGLYLHDGSVYNVHLHVPLWVRHPQRPPSRVDDVVSTRDLFGLMAAAISGDFEGTILDESYRAAHPTAQAEHFHYPHLSNMLPRFASDHGASITTEEKVIRQGGQSIRYDLRRDPDESAPA